MFSYQFQYHLNIHWKITEIAFDSFLYLNIIVNFMTGYYDELMQHVVLDCRGIFR